MKSVILLAVAVPVLILVAAALGTLALIIPKGPHEQLPGNRLSAVLGDLDELGTG